MERIECWNTVFKESFSFLFSSSSATGVMSRIKKNKSRDQGVVKQKRSEEEVTENKKADDSEPDEMVTNQGNATATAKNDTNYPEGSNKDVEKHSQRTVIQTLHLMKIYTRMWVWENESERTVTDETK